jgi:hypothetical protein
VRRIPRAEAAITQHSRKYASAKSSDMGWFEVPHNIDEIACSIVYRSNEVDDS